MLAAALSHPVWVRGLKHKATSVVLLLYVAPRVGAWIETLRAAQAKQKFLESHPVWVRGLKQNKIVKHTILRKVAPRVGAWIETPIRRAAYLP